MNEFSDLLSEKEKVRERHTATICLGVGGEGCFDSLGSQWVWESHSVTHNHAWQKPKAILEHAFFRRKGKEGRKGKRKGDTRPTIKVAG
jgi:hypothetical protein